MSQLGMLWQCLAMCGLMGAFCTLLAVPLFAWLGVRAIASQIRAMSNDGPWQAPLAAIAAALPSLLFLSIGGLTLSTAAQLPSSSMLVCRVSMAMIEIALFAGVVRAALRTAAHRRESHRLIARSLPASVRLQAFASRYHLCLRELDDETLFCGVAGVFHPVMLVSCGASACLSDGELDAALLHERAHVRRGDQILAAALTFCVDCLPLPASDLIETYRMAREFVADRDAAAQSDPHDLAGAILAIATGMRDSHAVAALASGTCLQARLRALIEAPQCATPPYSRRALLSAWLAAIAIISCVPFVTHTFHL